MSVEKISYNKDIQKLIHDNLERFVGEFPDLVDSLYKYKSNPNCGCRKTLYKAFMADQEKFNRTVSGLMGKDVKVQFGTKIITEPHYEEFDTMKQVHERLVQLKNDDYVIRSFSVVSENGKYVLICI